MAWSGFLELLWTEWYLMIQVTRQSCDYFRFLFIQPIMSGDYSKLDRMVLTALLNNLHVFMVYFTSPDPDSFQRNLSLTLTDWFHGFYSARVRKSLALKTLVSAAAGFWAHFNIVLLTYLLILQPKCHSSHLTDSVNSLFFVLQLNFTR